MEQETRIGGPENGIRWEFTGDQEAGCDVDFFVGNTLVSGVCCKGGRGQADISAKSFIATHRAIGRRLLALTLSDGKGYFVVVDDIDTGKSVFETAAFFLEDMAWRAAEEWCKANPEPAPGDMMPEAHEPAPAAARESAGPEIEAEGDRKVVDRPGGPMTQPAPSVSIKPPKTTPRTVLNNPDELDALFKEILALEEDLRCATVELNETKEHHKEVKSALDNAHSRLTLLWKNGATGQVALPLGEAKGPAPAKLGDVTDHEWAFNGRTWAIKLKKLGVDQYLAMIPELAGDTDGHGQTVEAAVEESKGKAAILLSDTDPGEKPAKRSKKKTSKKTGPKKAAKKAAKKRSANKRAPRGKATVTEGKAG